MPTYERYAPSGEYTDVDGLFLDGDRLFAAAYSGAVLALDATKAARPVLLRRSQRQFRRETDANASRHDHAPGPQRIMDAENRAAPTGGDPKRLSQ